MRINPSRPPERQQRRALLRALRLLEGTNGKRLPLRLRDDVVQGIHLRRVRSGAGEWRDEAVGVCG